MVAMATAKRTRTAVQLAGMGPSVELTEHYDHINRRTEGTTSEALPS
jgi:hypothetical protein